MRYFTSDHHFTDPRLNLFPRFFKSVEDMNAHMISVWNEHINPDDEVYYLGDFSFTEEGLENVYKLNGKKHLIIGNHDEKHGLKTLKPYFESVQNNLDLTLKDGDNSVDVHLVHYPSKGTSKMFNLVGHIHGNWRVQKNMLNVGVDVWHYKPITEKEVLFFFNAICNFYDDDVWVSNLYSNSKHNDRGKIDRDMKLKSLIHKSKNSES